VDLSAQDCKREKIHLVLDFVPQSKRATRLAALFDLDNGQEVIPIR
jgi:hypothetical protein